MRGENGVMFWVGFFYPDNLFRVIRVTVLIAEEKPPHRLEFKSAVLLPALSRAHV